MYSSAMLESKFTGVYNSADTHELFTSIHEKITELEEMRIIEKLARPASREAKSKLMKAVNDRLLEVRDAMDEICSLSHLLKNKEDALVKEIFVTAHAWKSGIRRIQTKISNFYELKMKHFSTINACSKLGLELVQLDEKEWAKDCFSKLSGMFCICG